MMIAYFSNNSYIKIQIIKEIIVNVDVLLEMYTSKNKSKCKHNHWVINVKVNGFV